MPKYEDMTGQKFNRLTVIGTTKKNGLLYRTCECDCGNITYTSATHLKKGTVRSCGCLQKEELALKNQKHGLSKKNERLYRIWKGMNSRCYIPSASGYKNYGARGIEVCEEWKDYSNFYKWALASGYSNSLTLERDDVNGNYEPDNCYWVTKESQANNKRSSVKTEVRGELLTLSQISKKYDINYRTLMNRYKKGDREEQLIREVEKRGIKQ